MQRPLDIFKFESDGTVTWKGTADNLEAAKLFVKILMGISPSDYLIFSQETGERTVVKLKDCA